MSGIVPETETYAAQAGFVGVIRAGIINTSDGSGGGELQRMNFTQDTDGFFDGSGMGTPAGASGWAMRRLVRREMYYVPST